MGYVRKEALTKISRPSPAGIFPRKRLFRRLDQSRLRPVIFINGPPGSGKTSLIASYIDARELPYLWYQVDEGDADVASFFYYMGLAAKHAMPRRRKALPLLTPEYLMGIKTFTLRFFAELYNRVHPPLTSQTKRERRKFLIVLDNYQEVSEESPFQAVVRDGLSALPEGINVIVISRSEPPRVFLQMQTNRQMDVIGWDELKLETEEARGIVRLLRDKRLSEDVLQEMHRKTEGWAAGLVLLAEYANKGGFETVFEDTHTPKEVFNYFADEILQNTTAEMQDFLQKTSFLRKFTPDMARDLTQNPQAARILSDLNRRNYFIQRHVSQVRVYQYHNLFREFLLEKAHEAFPSDELSRIRHHAARLCKEAGQSEEAVDLFIEGGAWDEATRLILQLAPTLVSQGRGMTLSAWIDTLLGATVQDNPYLLYWKGICHLPFSPPRGREYLQKAFHLFETGQDAEGVFLAWSAIVNSFLSEWDDFTPLDPWVEWLDKRLSDGSTPSPAVYGPVAVSMIWALTYRKPWHPDIRTWADRAMSLSQNHPDPNLRVQACIIVSTYNYFMGEEAQGVLPAREGRRIARWGEVSPLTLLGMKFIEIILHWFTSAPGSSSGLISEGLAIAEKTGVHIYDSMLYSYAVCDFLTKGALAEAGELLRKMESMIGGNQRCALGHYHYVLAWYYILLNDLPSAAVHAERGAQIPSEIGMPFGEANGRILLAFVLQSKGEPGKAFEQIEMARKIGLRAKSSLLEWLCDLADAWVAFDTGQEKLGFESLKRAMAMGRTKGFMNYEGWLPSVMTRLCAKALEKGIEVEYVKDLIRKRGLIPDTPPYECEDWPWGLKIYTLGRFEIVKDEKALQYPVRAPRVPLTLLKAIIAFGSGGVKEDQLADVLWPEADGDTAHQTFKTTLHRLRQLAGDERTIEVRDGRVMLDQQYCWVDAYAFEFLLEKAVRLLEENEEAKDSSTEGVRLAEKALSLYRGTFLGEEANETWIITYQERLRSKFIRAVRRLGNHYEKRGQWERAMECYQKGLEADELAEEFYQRLMSSYLSLGRRAEAIAVYNRCGKILQSTLGIDPSSTTEKIFRVLKEKVED